ncbi:peptide-N-glycosidase F-related protein [Paraliomyxa miuraensis]|uniref:peptide-N-glycosidase F-related protein n=1 Tax=Paraliomyxa miuraensis TaxID=376150 RepID=UPI0022555707|nr:peptide-N-glycosidase F-related protein [Paraliomyxa miuraensis]MCX4246070.1 peptide-N-glycosidase F-related protein [Paraliomyxa miuraensis]
MASTTAGESTAMADGESSGSTTGAPPVEPGPDTSVAAFDGAHVYFLGDDNMRSIDVEVEFPPAMFGYESVTLELGLRCPNGLCDWWDRFGNIAVVEDAGTEQERVIEVARFITPYRVAGEWSIDVSALRPLLSGPRTLRVFIDTWVGPGHANGDGWLVDARFDFVGGVPAELPVEVIPLWPYAEATIGDPMLPVDGQLEPTMAEIPDWASRVELRSVITGHGQGNLDNCAEFCGLTHGYLVGNAAVQRLVWRDDCADNPIDNQQGTWTYPRAGWCPGADVIAWVEDVTGGVSPGDAVQVLYDLSDYENTCRPDSPVCMGCALGTGCDYDGGAHTPPVIKMSAMLVVYRAT